MEGWTGGWMDGWMGEGEMEERQKKRERAHEASRRFLHNRRLYISLKQEATQLSTSYT